MSDQTSTPDIEKALLLLHAIRERAIDAGHAHIYGLAGKAMDALKPWWRPADESSAGDEQ